jgi:hypothetical protein
MFGYLELEISSLKQELKELQEKNVLLKQELEDARSAISNLLDSGDIGHGGLGKGTDGRYWYYDRVRHDFYVLFEYSKNMVTEFIEQWK